MPKTVLCIDIGTTSLKAAVISKDGLQTAFAQKPFANPDSRYISKDWITQLQNCIEGMKSFIKDVEAVSISGNGPTVVTEKNDTVLWNAKTDSLLSEINNSTSSLFLPKIAALRKAYADEFEKSETVFSGPEYLIYFLTGNKVTILPESRYKNAYWTDELLELNNMDSGKFPPFRKIGESYGTVNLEEKTSGNLYLLQGLPVYGCGPDFIAAMIGTECTSIGALCDCAGSSEGFNLCISLPFKDPRIRLLPSVTPGLWNAAVMIPESGRLLFNYKNKMEKETGRLWTYPELIDFCFDSSESEGHDILETLLKNSEYAVSVLKDVAEKCGIQFPDHMFVAGGQAKNKRWMAEKEKRLGIKLEVSSIPDAELLGNWKIIDNCPN